MPFPPRATTSTLRASTNWCAWPTWPSPPRAGATSRRRSRSPRAKPYSDWAIDERWRYERRVIDTAVAASTAAMDDRDARRALEHAERAIALEPLDERGYQAGLLALHALGRDRDAIALYDRYCAAAIDDDGDALRELRATIGRREAINVKPRGDGPPQAITGALTPRLLGRAAELAVLGRALDATSDGGSELVLVEGERGIGKTTLLEAASRELGDSVRVGWARCSELVSGIPYAALALALREVLGRSEVDVRDYPALAGIFPEMRVRSTRSAPRTVDALEALVALVMALAPLVLFLDDLQWADSDTLVALGYLGNRGPLRGVTIVGAVRPEEVESAHPVARLRPTMRIPLGELGEHELAPLGIADLHHRTDGHPLFVSLAIADDAGGRLSLSQWVSDRCRAEGDDPYRLLTAACLLEESFSASRLAGVLDLKTADVADSLDRLCRTRRAARAERQAVEPPPRREPRGAAHDPPATCAQAGPRELARSAGAQPRCANSAETFWLAIPRRGDRQSFSKGPAGRVVFLWKPSPTGNLSGWPLARSCSRSRLQPSRSRPTASGWSPGPSASAPAGPTPPPPSCRRSPCSRSASRRARRSASCACSPRARSPGSRINSSAP